VIAKRLLNTFFILMLGLLYPFNIFSEEIYEYERMWPVLKQPWYFNSPAGMAIGNDGNIYIADMYNCLIQKFTLDGQFVTKWGSQGNGDGQFQLPHGIAIDTNGIVYVADPRKKNIQKFTADGRFISKWGVYGSGVGQFLHPSDLAIDKFGNIYVADGNEHSSGDRGNHRIQKFTSNGEFITEWGGYGTGDGEFNGPSGIAIDAEGNIYVSDCGNHRIQKFDSSGRFLKKWGQYGSSDGEFNEPNHLEIGPDGYLYVTDGENGRIQKFTREGEFVSKWGKWAWIPKEGEFRWPQGIAIDINGNVYISEYAGHRFQKFTNYGQFISQWSSSGSDAGMFKDARGIAVDKSINVYVADTWNHRIQKFSKEGNFIMQWDGNGLEYPGGVTVDNTGNVFVINFNYFIRQFNSYGVFLKEWGGDGSADGQFNFAIDLSTDSAGNVYGVDHYLNRVQKFTSDGKFIAKWGREGLGDGEFQGVTGIATDKEGNVYVVDLNTDRVQKFTSDGMFISKWQAGWSPGNLGSTAIAIDQDTNIYVSNSYKIRKFNPKGELITELGTRGSNPGQIESMGGLTVSSDGDIYMIDSANNRIQVFGKVSKPFNDKAIILAGSGPYKGNNLWDATEMNANFAYRVLTYQGYTNDTIYYLSSDRNLDLNGDGIPDVDGEATNSNLQNAITQWAKDAESLVVYLIGHGGNGTFRMSETEVLKAEDFASWLNGLQETMQGLVTIIYDACESGSFVSKLVPPSGKQRIIITSTSPGEPAYFLSQGALSFSYTFWSQIFSGAKIYDAYVVGKDVIGVAMGAGKSQNPEIDDNGNGVGNEKTDGDVARNKYIGKGFAIAGDIPSISTISQDQVLNGQASATITVEIVTTGRITKVWAIVHSPDFTNPTDTPITNLPSFDLTWNEQNRRYEGTYNGFTVMGTYTVTVYAMNEQMIVSLPKTTKITQTIGESPSNRCDFNGDGKTDILWRNKSTGKNIVWFMNDATYSSYVELLQVTDTNWQVVGTGDFNSDGKTDILWRNKATGQNVVWYMNGTAYSSYAELMQVPDTNWQIVGTGDFSGDGKTDILWRNKSTGQNVLWFMNGTTYTSYAELMQVTDTNWLIVGAGDFNSDGKTDILWRNKSTGQNVVWYMNGANYSNYVELLQVTDTNWEIVGTGDFNGDGKTDILWRNKSTGQNIIWFMNGATYNSYAELMQVPDTNWEIVGPK
jgi:sugar lactone lactonase YvrE